MNVKHLEFFVTIAQHGSINKAAQVLYMSQPHLSHIIKDLENDVGFPLFQRTQQGVTLTEHGEQFLEHANIILKEMDNLKKISCKSGPNNEQFRVGMTKFSHTMESFNMVCSRHEHCGTYSFSLHEGSTVDIVEEVLSNDVDVGVIHCSSHEIDSFKSSLDKKGLVFNHIASIVPHICVSKNHELFRLNKPITLETIQNYGFVRYSGQYEDFIYEISTKTQHLDLNISPKIAYVYGRSTLLHLISQSNFYTIGIQDFSTQESMYNVVSVPIKNSTERIEFGIIQKKDILLSDIELEFIQDVTKRYQQLQQRQ